MIRVNLARGPLAPHRPSRQSIRDIVVEMMKRATPTYTLDRQSGTLTMSYKHDPSSCLVCTFVREGLWHACPLSLETVTLPIEDEKLLRDNLWDLYFSS